MDSQKQEIVEKLQSANNILVTVSSSPSVDQLSACIGLTLLLNKLDKHATAVFSGEIPSTIEFLKPEETIEKNTDSLRDFIIALDKSKADKLRYKVEDKVVKIFITPYRTSLSADDLNFSQGDFNIDVVLALGVHQQTDLDQAITSHGRILHDATVACINNTPNGELGTVNWSKPDASSLSELVVDLAKSFDKPLLDEQIANALLTGIVAETDRFRNEKTTAATMTLSAELMQAGANQQLVAEKLEHEVDLHRDNNEKPAEAHKENDEPADKPAQTKKDDGTLEIDHVKQTQQSAVLEEQASEPGPEDQPTLPEPQLPKPEAHDESEVSRSMITEAPTLGGQLTANTTPEEASYDPTLGPPSSSKDGQSLLSHDSTNTKAASVEPPAPELPKPQPKQFVPPTPPVAPTPPQFTPPPMPPVPSMPPTPPPAPTPVPRPAPTPEPPKPQPKAPDLPPPASQPPQPVSFAPPKPPTPASLTEAEEPKTPPKDEVDEIQKARDEVLKAINEQSDTNLPPVQALNAQPVELGARPSDQPPVSGGGQLTPPNPPGPQPATPLPPNVPDAAPFANSPADQPLTMPMPPGITLPPPQTAPPTNAPSSSPNSPPPVPPPMMPPGFGK